MSQPNSSELAVLKHLWSAGPQSAREVHDAIGPGQGWKPSTTRTVIARMEEKGWVTRADVHGMAVFSAALDRTATLGGLVRQARTDLIRSVIEGLRKDLSWCSSDPVCIDGTISLSTPLNGAACHACVLAPETSCEYQNLALDRALLVGTPDDPDIGFLSRLDAGREGP